MHRKNPFRCYDVRFLIEALVAAVAVIVLAKLGKRYEPGSPLRLTFVVLESAVFGVLIARTLLALRKLDELQQRIHLVAIAISFGLTAAVVTTTGFLDGAGFHMPAAGLWIWGFMSVVWGLATFVLARRYR